MRKRSLAHFKKNKIKISQLARVAHFEFFIF